MLEEQELVVDRPGDPGLDELALQGPGGAVVDPAEPAHVHAAVEPSGDAASGRARPRASSDRTAVSMSPR